MDILSYSSYEFLPSVLYLILLLFLSLRSKATGQSLVFSALIQAAIFVILLIHGMVIHDSVFTPQGFVFGFAQDLSLIAWAGLAFYWFQSWFMPISSLRWIAVLFVMIYAFLPTIFPGALLSPRAFQTHGLKGTSLSPRLLLDCLVWQQCMPC